MTFNELAIGAFFLYRDISNSNELSLGVKIATNTYLSYSSRFGAKGLRTLEDRVLNFKVEFADIVIIARAREFVDVGGYTLKAEISAFESRNKKPFVIDIRGCVSDEEARKAGYEA